jgi:acetyltransferase-like isoleucine patch superfamily enzyme
VNDFRKLPDGIKLQFEGANTTIRLELPLTVVYLEIIAGNDSCVDIGAGCNIYFLAIMTGNKTRCRVGQACRVGNLRVYADDGAQCSIGDGCLFSIGISIRACDGHSILDYKTSKIINRPKRTVSIGDHCWLGENVLMNKNASIPDDTIVGIGSVVTKEFTEPHTAIAGNPARVVKTGITWDKREIFTLEKNRKGDS